MFDNISQALFNIGATGYMIIVPILRFLATLFMFISTYKLLKARQDTHKIIWLIAILIAPFWVRILYEIYRRFFKKMDIKTPKGSTPCLILSIILTIFTCILSVISIITLGAGFIKSEIDNEPIAIYYDVHGNEYYDLYEVPLYDKQGNSYTYESQWFVVGPYIDQDGNELDGSYCYLTEDGYLYYDANNELVPYEDYYDYYTDGENIYYSLLGNPVYHDEDGAIWYKSGRFSLLMFDFE